MQGWVAKEEKMKKILKKIAIFVIIALIIPIVVGLSVNKIWHILTDIKPDKVFLGTQYANYYNNYQNSSAEDNFRIFTEPLPLPISQDRLWLAIANGNIRSLKETSLHIIFPDGVIVDKENSRWQDILPNKRYTYVINSNINNDIAEGLPFLTVKFSEIGKYKIGYSISAEDMEHKRGSFIIDVYN